MSDYEEIPSSLYRLQFNEDFTFKKALEILPYLKELGIEGVYCSPFYESVHAHGYDVTNPNALNPVIGTMAEFELFCLKLKKMGFSLIIDVVPNHMGIKKGKNAWWQDVLENGPYSEYASFFDINWSPEKRELQDKVLLPILGDTYGAVLENQEIRLHFHEGVFFFQFADFPLPVAPHTYPRILQPGSDELKKNSHFDEFQQIIDLYKQFPVTFQERTVKKEEARFRLQALCENEPEIRHFIQKRVAELNGKKRFHESFDDLDKLLELQFYRLSYWKVANHEINYRRFFNIHELAAISMEKQTVFEAHHKWILELLKDKKVLGFRIDHPDGLFDPVTYFRRLREKGCTYTIVEKILDRKEELPEDWEVEGTVGYEYLNILSGIFIRQDAEKAFTEIYENFVCERFNFDEIVYEAKRVFALFHMVSEVESLALLLDRLSEKNRRFRDFTRFDLTKALQEVIAFFPVYRTYIGPEGGVSKRDANYLKIAIEKAKQAAHHVDISIFDFLEKLLLLKLKLKDEETQGYRDFILRFQQLTGPIMAKGMEDTAFYIYNRLLSLNEVGGDPPHFGYSVEDLHRFNQRKKEKWPYGFLASSTHDTKRSEDVRMRLNVLSEIPQEWDLKLKKWEKINAKHRKENAPTRNTEYALYQLLLGAWPKEGLRHDKRDQFLNRLWEVLLKSLREGQIETSWLNPNTSYEENVKHFLSSILTFDKHNHFLSDFLPFQRKLDFLGGWNSLSMVGIKIADCGIAELYQGNETWHYCLVDPDNRRVIDYANNELLLKEIFDGKRDLLHAKLFIQWKALNFRKAHKDLFLEGEYTPLQISGKQKEHIVAFLRKTPEKTVIVIALRFFSTLLSDPLKWAIPPSLWEDTQIHVPSDYLGKEWIDLFTEKKVGIYPEVKHGIIKPEALFEHFPVTYLYEPTAFASPAMAP